MTWFRAYWSKQGRIYVPDLNKHFRNVYLLKQSFHKKIKCLGWSPKNTEKSNYMSLNFNRRCVLCHWKYFALHDIVWQDRHTQNKLIKSSFHFVLPWVNFRFQFRGEPVYTPVVVKVLNSIKWSWFNIVTCNIKNLFHESIFYKCQEIDLINMYRAPHQNLDLPDAYVFFHKR